MILASNGNQKFAAGRAKLTGGYRVPHQLVSVLGEGPLHRQVRVVRGDGCGHVDVCLTGVNADIQGDDRQDGDGLGLLVDLPCSVRIGGCQHIGPRLRQSQRPAFIVEAVRHRIGFPVLRQIPDNRAVAPIFEPQLHVCLLICVCILRERESKRDYRQDSHRLFTGVRIASTLGNAFEGIGAFFGKGQRTAFIREASQVLRNAVLGQAPLHAAGIGEGGFNRRGVTDIEEARHGEFNVWLLYDD